MAPSPALSTRTRWALGSAAGAVGIGALAYIGLGDPHRPGFFPPCPFLEMTGWLCPGCGGLRMTHDLLHADIAAAFVDNAFILIGVPLLIVWALIRRRQSRRVFTVSALAVIFAAVIAWTIVRNLPGFPLVPTLLTG